MVNRLWSYGSWDIEGRNIKKAADSAKIPKSCIFKGWRLICSLSSIRWYISFLHFKAFKIQFHGVTLCIMFWSVNIYMPKMTLSSLFIQISFFNIKFVNFWYITCFVSNVSSNVNEVIKTILSQCIFNKKRYCTHKNTHKQKSTNKTKIN